MPNHLIKTDRPTAMSLGTLLSCTAPTVAYLQR